MIAQRCSRLAAYRSPQHFHFHYTTSPPLRGGASRDRTDDIQLAKLALSQLSYGPVYTPTPRLVVGLTRLELVTPRLSSVCSNQLSYRPGKIQGTLPDSSSDNLLWTLAAAFS